MHIELILEFSCDNDCLSLSIWFLKELVEK